MHIHCLNGYDILNAVIKYLGWMLLVSVANESMVGWWGGWNACSTDYTHTDTHTHIYIYTYSDRPSVIRPYVTELRAMCHGHLGLLPLQKPWHGDRILQTGRDSLPGRTSCNIARTQAILSSILYGQYNVHQVIASCMYPWHYTCNNIIYI